MSFDELKELDEIHQKYQNQLTEKDTTIKEQAENIEKLTGLLKGLITGNHGDEEAKYIWNNYKEQHGI